MLVFPILLPQEEQHTTAFGWVLPGFPTVERGSARQACCDLRKLMSLLFLGDWDGLTSVISLCCGASKFPTLTVPSPSGTELSRERPQRLGKTEQNSQSPFGGDAG